MYMSDMSAMSNSIENRSPLMDHKLLVMLSISDKFKNEMVRGVIENYKVEEVSKVC